jgi:hypothetical protein
MKPWKIDSQVPEQEQKQNTKHRKALKSENQRHRKVVKVRNPCDDRFDEPDLLKRARRTPEEEEEAAT